MGELIPMCSVSFSPDVNLVLGVSAATSPSRKGVYIWEASTGVKHLKFTRHTDTVQRVLFSPCGRYIALVGTDQTVCVFRIQDWSCVAMFFGYGRAVERRAFSPDGRTLSSGTRHGTVVIRQMHNISSSLTTYSSVVHSSRHVCWRNDPSHPSHPLLI